MSASRAVGGDRLEAAARVGGELRRREPRGLALDGDHRQVVRHDVVQLARDPRSLLHRGLLAHALCHRLLRRVELGDHLRALARRLCQEHCSCNEEKWRHACRVSVTAVERCGGVEEERQQERDREEEAPPKHELAQRVQQHAERRQSDRRFGRSEQHQREERRGGGGQERESLRGDERNDRQHVHEDGHRRVVLLLEAEAVLVPGCVEARLERSRHAQDQRERKPAVAAREDAPGGLERAAAGLEHALALASKLHAGIVDVGTPVRVALLRHLRPHPGG